MNSILAEYGFSYNDYDAPKTLKSLIEAIRIKSKFENLSCKWLIVLDEVVIVWGERDFSTLSLDDDDNNIEFVVAVNPGGIRKPYTIIPPQDKKIITMRLTFKHRNSLEISVFLAHFKKLPIFYSYYAISEANDKNLAESCFPAIDKVKICFTFSIILHDLSNLLFLEFC